TKRAASSARFRRSATRSPSRRSPLRSPRTSLHFHLRSRPRLPSYLPAYLATEPKATGGAPRPAPRPRTKRIPFFRTPLVSRRHQRRDREPVVDDARLLALVEVPALLTGKAQARERGLRRVLE